MNKKYCKDCLFSHKKKGMDFILICHCVDSYNFGEIVLEHDYCEYWKDLPF